LQIGAIDTQWVERTDLVATKPNVPKVAMDSRQSESSFSKKTDRNMARFVACWATAAVRSGVVIKNSVYAIFEGR